MIGDTSIITDVLPATRCFHIISEVDWFTRWRDSRRAEVCKTTAVFRVGLFKTERSLSEVDGLIFICNGDSYKEDFVKAEKKIVQVLYKCYSLIRSEKCVAGC